MKKTTTQKNFEEVLHLYAVEKEKTRALLEVAKAIYRRYVDEGQGLTVGQLDTLGEVIAEFEKGA